MNHFLTLQKKVFFLQFDFYKYYFYNYSKTTAFLNNRIISLKNKITQN